jgi:hypothetical protein
MRQIPIPTRRALVAVRAAEDRIRFDDLESVLVFDRNGREIFRRVGHQDSVDVSASDLRMMRDAIITHNHPGGLVDGPPALRGTSFSTTDVELAAFVQAAEVRVVTAGWRYRLRSPADGWSQNWWQRTLTPAIHRARQAAIDHLRQRMIEGRLHRTEATALLMHEIWTRVAKELDMTYIRTRIRP